jgi:hypothetical protein
MSISHVYTVIVHLRNIEKKMFLFLHEEMCENYPHLPMILHPIPSKFLFFNSVHFFIFIVLDEHTSTYTTC